MNYPQYVNEILMQLQAHGYQGWIVGGAVRDAWRGIEPNDYDIATTAFPTDISEIFSHSIPTGIEHGTMTVVIGDKVVEVTTLRYDGEYDDGRRPKEVFFTDDIRADLARRDFTINAMAYSPKDGLIDPFQGQADLKKHLIRCVGDPEMRFQEDALRLLRAIRFATVLDGKIAPETWSALINQAQNLAKVSRERITSELMQIMTARRPAVGLQMLAASGLLPIICPELATLVGFDQHSRYHHLTVWEHTLAVVDNVKNTAELRLAALFHDIAKPRTFTLDANNRGHFYDHEKLSAMMAEQIMEQWRLPKQMIKRVKMLISMHMLKYDRIKRVKAKKWLQQVGSENVSDICCLMVADEFGKRPPYRLQRIYQLENLCQEILDSGEPLSTADLALSGHDLKDMGLVGPDIGVILNQLLILVLNEPHLNQAELLRQRAQKMMAELLS